MKNNYLMCLRTSFWQTCLVVFLVWAGGNQVFAANPNTVSVLLQSETISGTVIDETGEPLPGVNVMVKGTSTGVTTTLDGSYTLNVSNGDAVLVFTFIGYMAQEVAINNRSRIDVSMVPDVKTLSEVVVIGYGQQEKRDVTAAIASLSSEAISAIPVSSTIQAMQGQISGVDIVSNGGRPGQAPNILIRGRRSISASNDPLFVIDGVPQASGTSSIYDINQQDIQSVEVLKDAAATAIYGSRGANGVILITTKRGASGKTILTYDSYVGVSNVITKVDMMNGEEFAAMKRESRRSSWDGTIPADADVFDDPIEIESLSLNRTTDYQDLVLGNGGQQSHQVGVRGGDDKTQFNISLGYFNEDGVIKGMDYTRMTSRVNLDHKINDIFKAGISFNSTYSINNWGSNAVMGESLSNNPLGVPYDANGVLKFLPTNDGIRTNPLSELVEGAYIDERKTYRILLPFYIEANIMEGLTFRTQFSPDVRIYRRGEFRGRYTNDNRGGPADAEIENIQQFSYTLENLVNYNKQINDRNKLNFTFLQSIQTDRRESYYTAVQNLPFETGSFYAMEYAEVKGNISSRLNEWLLASYMGRVSYDFDGKYLFQASLRADGSSRLGRKETRWQYFPGISAGWRIIDEAFMENVDFISELKLRASYGQVGNTSVGPYQTKGRLARSVYAWDESPAFGFSLYEIPNRDLGWEISKTIDFGLDFGLIEGKLSGSIDYYSTNTSNLLLKRALPPSSGYANVLQNIGATNSSGIEFMLSANVLSNNEGLNWDVDFNITHFNEKIVELALKDADGNPLDDIGNEWFIGQPLNVFYSYEKSGIWQANEVDQALLMENKVPGEIKLKDLDGDGVITPNDRRILGSDIPDFYGGINNKLSYKGFNLSVFLIYRQGQMFRSRFHDSNNSLFARYNNLDVDYWTIDNPTNAYPRPNENQEFPRDGITLTYFDGSYVKLRNITLGYNLPSSVIDKFKMSSMRVYFSAQNPKFWAKYDTYDPEVPAEASSSTVPSSRLFMGGINVTF